MNSYRTEDGRIITVKTGKVILGDTFKKTSFILEDGMPPHHGQIYKFDPKTVNGNLSLDPQAREYPARLTDQIVRFHLDKNNTVVAVEILIFQKSIHDKCASGLVTLAAKSCACGNTTNSVYKHCQVCAIQKDECVLCGKGLYN